MQHCTSGWETGAGLRREAPGREAGRGPLLHQLRPSGDCTPPLLGLAFEPSGIKSQLSFYLFIFLKSFMATRSSLPFKVYNEMG